MVFLWFAKRLCGYVVRVQIRYTGFRDRPQEERQIRFQNGCREGHSELAFVASGTNLQLVFNPMQPPYTPDRDCDFDKEHGKVRTILILCGGAGGDIMCSEWGANSDAMFAGGCYVAGLVGMRSGYFVERICFAVLYIRICEL